jgi:peptide/nickel transport system permease protein
MIPVILGVAILIFTIMYFVPGDPARFILGVEATAADVAVKRHEMGLDDPYPVQLVRFLYDTFIRFDLGTSYVFNTPVLSELMIRLPNTLAIGLLCMLLQVVVGIPLGVTAAVHHNGFADRLCMFIALLGVSIPSFWFGLMLVLLFSLKLGILPAYGIGGIQYFIMPCICNSFAGIATQARQTRSSMLDVIRSDYITTARAKGMSEHEVIYKHALPNALIPVITVLGNGLANIFGGAVVIETVFSIPGVGLYMTGAIGNRDYPVVRGCVVLLAIVFSMIVLLVDLVYAFVDPRIRAQFEGQHKKPGRGKHHGHHRVRWQGRFRGDRYGKGGREANE